MESVLRPERLVTPGSVVAGGEVAVEGGRIARVGPAGGPPQPALRGLTLMPGLVDLHCDAIEFAVEPRAGVRFPADVAVRQMDRANAAAGVTTAYHGLSVDDDEFNRRSPESVAEMLAALADYAPYALIDHRVHCRYEVTAPAGFEAVRGWLGAGRVDLISFMDHTPGRGNMAVIETYQKFVFKRMGRFLTEEQLRVVIERKNLSRETADGRVRELTAMALARGVPAAGHDLGSPAEAAECREIGMTLCEFPLDLETARAARAAGLRTILGAPNLLRGGSHVGALSALEAIRHGVADCLCSDYAPQSLLPAVWRLPELAGLPLAEAVGLVTGAPAAAAGLADRGRVAEGCRADLIAVREVAGRPEVAAAWVAGRMVYMAGMSSWGDLGGD